MDQVTDLSGVLLTALKTIPSPLGSVLHAQQKSAPGFAGFGEAYFSTVLPKAVKGWKRHTEMVLNLVVCVGAVRFCLLDNRLAAPECPLAREVTLSRDFYYRLTIPAGIWVAFQGVADAESILLNIASIEHNPAEAETRTLDDPMFSGFRF